MNESVFTPNLAEPAVAPDWDLRLEEDIPGPSLGDGSATVAEPAAPGGRRWIARCGGAIASATEWAFGALALGLGLALLAATPLAQFLSLGYLLEAEGRVARGGRLRDGLVGVRRAARVGTIILGTWLWLLPARLVASMARSAELIDPGGPIARRWRIGLIALIVVTVLHIAIACARGGRFRDFLWPPSDPGWLVRRLRRGRLYGDARDAVWEFVMGLRLPSYFRLGLFGFAGALA